MCPVSSDFTSYIMMKLLSFIEKFNSVFRATVCTIDINLSELEYLAAHLDSFECRRLIAAMHYKTYDLPQLIAGAERKIDGDVLCLRQLLHWNNSPSEGVGATHEDLEHRLRQINRHDLATWLGKTVFKELRSDIEKSLKKVFRQFGEQEIQTQYPITLEPIHQVEEEDPWTEVDTILMILLVGLAGSLMLIVLSLINHRVRNFLFQKKQETLSNFDEEKEKLLNSDTD
ncbi:uncharacterized protein [Fopius arisanus]|uniref:Uncharacterized protein isoform X2 n=1 Tax=Fopius arisanus TaxID=64838 RepID=A0A9R1U7T5_9HYME|nr:PREDICTED: uncharacterized protein LOC105270801 isoform X2 [Fopius arisanus]XP_011310300.1 PREDICTED: uncharacterized protein LOC105270801 isoform X2 [Fopius arisanus]XP_011310311.1 PREDICTED: uncharacterized protein LOC105270801 isoform X2 [Fopius arisanus]